MLAFKSPLISSCLHAFKVTFSPVYKHLKNQTTKKHKYKHSQIQTIYTCLNQKDKEHNGDKIIYSYCYCYMY